MSFCTCHTTCRTIIASCNHPRGPAFSAFALPCNNYYGKEMVVLVGKERSGAYRNQFNLIGGKGEKTDTCVHCGKLCWIACLWREVSEEGKIKLNKASFEKYFRSKVTGLIRVHVHKRTPIFIGVFPGLSRGPLNRQIQADNSNPRLPSDQKEMSKVQWVRMSDQTTQPGSNRRLNVTTFAQPVIEIAWKKRLFQ